MQRKIAHIDMDAFYVSVEIRDNPSLAGKPVAVGGKSDRRGVLSTCNYIARKFGVSSAMPTAMAIKKCPHLVVVPGRMDVYVAVSKQIRSVFERFTEKIEPLSLDEAYLDLTECSFHHGSATLIAQQIRQDIFHATGLTASAGIAPIKYLAKIASDMNKPNGQFTIAPNDVTAFIDTMKLNKIPGVGKVTNEKLKHLGLFTGRDVVKSDIEFLTKHFGKMGAVLWDRCHGIDPREVEVSRIRKSVGVEQTFSEDIHSLPELQRIVSEVLLPQLIRRVEPHLKTREIDKLGVKVKFQDFHITTKEQKHSDIDDTLIFQLLAQAIERGKGKSVRLLGLHVAFTDNSHNFKQLPLDFDDKHRTI
ncbi:DNA polymerase IV [Alteromonas sp. 5E99-2]|uniref:DNA polymerase IV n=1 Tax=Alteromonas sp. 5E99-2 TaxID=2817683 RepID=UPI001A97FB71|nr:DNA polymerase IV [Alteromonas sp. 5E99-2]